MKPVVSVEEMREIDRTASIPEVTLIERSGWAVARVALSMLGGTYGRRVVVVAGKGNNGADGRAAAEFLSQRGVRCLAVDLSEKSLPEADLLIDAAFGTGFRGSYESPRVHCPVLAVDIPSGVNGDTGEASSAVAGADRTVAIAALKPGHLLNEGVERSRSVQVADIGLDMSNATMALIEKSDVVQRIPPLKRKSHKWMSSVMVVAGSAGMMGAATLASMSAARTGAGMVRLATPGIESHALEAVSTKLPERGWETEVLATIDRFKALVIGPGLGRDEATLASVREVVSRADIPVLIDADGLVAFSGDQIDLLAKRAAPTVLTPHDGEFKSLASHHPSSHRHDDALQLARRTNAVVLLKGSTTVVADPNSRKRFFISQADGRLATAGTGDVLSGIIGALLAQGLDPTWAAACGAYMHGAASSLGPSRGLIAGDLPPLVSKWLCDNAAFNVE